MQKLGRVNPCARRSLLLILGLALLLRAGFGLTRQGLEASADERHWDRTAGAFWREGILSGQAGTYRPPLYPLLLAATYQVCGHRPAVVRLWQAVLGAATCAVLFAIGRRLAGTRTGLIAAAVAAAYPHFVFFSGALMAETLLIFLTAVALLQALRLEERPDLSRAAVLGIVLGLAGLCKPVLLAWAPPLLWGWWRRAKLERRARLGRLAAAAFGLALVVAPWTGRNAALTGHLVPVSTNLGINLLIGHEPGASGAYRDGVDYLGMYDELVAPEQDPVLRDRLAVRRVAGWMVAGPLRTAALAGRKLALFWSPLVTGETGWRSGVALLTSGPLLVLGLWGAWRLRAHPGGRIIGSLSLVLSLVHALIFVHTRFRLPVDAALTGPAALVLSGFWERRQEDRG